MYGCLGVVCPSRIQIRTREKSVLGYRRVEGRCSAGQQDRRTYNCHERGFPTPGRADEKECWESSRSTGAEYEKVKQQRGEEDDDNYSDQDGKRRVEKRRQEEGGAQG